MKPLLTICLPTIESRKEQFAALKEYIELQTKKHGKNIEIITLCDNKEMSIGEKRQRLYEMAKGLYSWQIDDDDSILKGSIDLVMEAIKKELADCITFKELCIFEDRQEQSSFSLQWKEWADNVGGFDHVRTPFCKTPIKTEICLHAGVKDMRYGEDHQFAKDVYPLLKTETYIDEFIYIYRYKFEPHETKYGIK